MLSLLILLGINQHHVDSLTDAYLFDSRAGPIEVLITGQYRSTSAEVAWMAKGKSRSQQITFKYPWYVNSSRDPMSDELDRPSAGLVQAKQPLIWLLTYNAE